MTVAAFSLSTIRCACGSAAVMCVAPGSGAELDPVFDAIVLRRGVAARGWCAQCWARLREGMGRDNAVRERLWFSPACLPRVQYDLFAESADDLLSEPERMA